MNTPTFRSFVKPLKNGSYFGAHDAEITSALANARESWRANYDPNSALESKKTARDRTSDLHVTILTPAETRKVVKAIGTDAIRDIFAGSFEFRAIGIGSIQDGDNVTWFVVLESPEIQDARAELGLRPKDLHATLGFITKDIFTTPKTEKTLVEDWRN